MKRNRHLYFKYKPYIMYAVSGTLSTLVNWLTYACCMDILPASSSKTNILTSNAIAWIVTLAFSYVFYKNWVFESKTHSLHELIREMLSFTGARFVTGLLEVFGVPVLVSCGMNHTVYGVEGFGAKIVVSLVVTVLNYVFSKLFVFKNTEAVAR